VFGFDISPDPMLNYHPIGIMRTTLGLILHGPRASTPNPMHAEVVRPNSGGPACPLPLTHER
jgi:hypothetical protein